MVEQDRWAIEKQQEMPVIEDAKEFIAELLEVYVLEHRIVDNRDE